MNSGEQIARVLIGLGLVMLISGIIFLLISRMGFTGFRLPGDIFIKRGNFTFAFPVVTCIVISIVLSIILNLVNRR
ncbi:MAG: DUF2905 domain-containing protein [Syntrophomonadaceae bacterium]|jgi:hypothetical protein